MAIEVYDDPYRAMRGRSRSPKAGSGPSAARAPAQTRATGDRSTLPRKASRQPVARPIDQAAPAAGELQERGAEDVEGVAVDPEVIPADLARLREEIRDCYEIVLASFRTSIRHAQKIGLLLTEAKKIVGHGGFSRWIEGNCPFSPRTARAYMRVASHGGFVPVEDDPNRQATADLTLDQVLKSLAKPRAASASSQTEGSANPAKSRRRRPETGEAGDRSESSTGAEQPGDDSTVVTDSAETPIDDGWLSGLPIRATLADPSIYDEQARLWRRLRPAHDHMLRLYRPTEEDSRVSRIKSRVQERYSYLVALLTGVAPPDRWTICERCKGTGQSPALRMECDWCRGGGFSIPQAEYEPTGAGCADT